MLVLGMLIPKESLLGPMEAPFEMEHKEIISKKVVTIDVTKGMSALINCIPVIIKVAFTVLPDKIVVVEVEALMVLLMAMGTTLTFLEDTVVIVVPRWLWWQPPDNSYGAGSKSSCSELSEGIDKTGKIDMLLKVSSKP